MVENTSIKYPDNYVEHFWPLIKYAYGVEILITFHILTMIISIVGNLLVITIILRSKTLLEEAAYLLICSVSVADFTVSILSQPLSIAFLLIHVENTPTMLNYIMFFCIWGFCGASAFGVVCVTIDRYLYIMYPMQYTRILSRRRTYIMIIIQWSCGLTYGLAPMIKIHESIFPTAVCALVTLVCMTACMAVIYNHIHMHIKKLQRDDLKKTVRSSRLSKRKQNNATVTIALIVFVFFLCWFPYIITNFVYATWKFSDDSPIRAAYYWTAGLGCWNSAFNVIIYGFKNGTLRNEAKKFLRMKTFEADSDNFSRSRNSINKRNDVVYSSSEEKEQEIVDVTSVKNEYSTFKTTYAAQRSFQNGIKNIQNGVKAMIKPKIPIGVRHINNTHFEHISTFTQDERNLDSRELTVKKAKRTNSMSNIQKKISSHLKPPNILLSESLPDLRHLIQGTDSKRESDKTKTKYDNLGFESDEDIEHEPDDESVKKPLKLSNIMLSTIHILASTPLQNYVNSFDETTNKNITFDFYLKKYNQTAPMITGEKQKHRTKYKSTIDCFNLQRQRAMTVTTNSNVTWSTTNKAQLHRKSSSASDLVLEDVSANQN